MTQSPRARVFVLPFLHLGVGRLVADLVLAVVDSTRCHVVTCGRSGHLGDDADLVSELTQAGVRFSRADLFSRDADAMAASARHVGSVCAEERPAVAHAFTAPAAAAALSHAPVVASVVGWAPDKSPEHRAMDAAILERCRLVTVVSEAVARDLRAAGLIREDTELVHNGVAVGAPASVRVATVPSDPPVVGVMAQLIERKGVDVLLDAVARVARTTPCRLVVAGTGVEEPRLRAQAERLGLDASVAWVGRCSLDRFFSDVDFVVVPSRSDALPMVLLHSMASGRAVIASRVGGIPEALRDGEHGLLVEPGDPAGLAHAIETTVRHPDAAGARARAARARITECFSRDVMIRRYLDCYRRAEAA